jgi:phage shock protein A
MPETILVPADKLTRMPQRPGGPRRPEAGRRPRREGPARPTFSLMELLPMSIFSRTRDIVAANFTDLLDKADDPAKMIRMIILEMEETLVEVRASAARTIADQKEMRRQILRLEKLQDSWTEKAELALSKGREDLAHGALTEKRKAADMADSLKVEIEVLDDAMRASEADIAKLQGKLREARMRQTATQSRLESANQRVRLREMTAGPKVDEAFSRFDLLERQVDYAEGRAEALALAAPPKTLDEEIAELRNADKVDAELEALKARLAANDKKGA